MVEFIQIFSHIISTFIQTAPIKSGSYGGVSGQDSIWRATAASMDPTLGMGFLVGICDMILNPYNFLRLPVWDFFHTRVGAKAHEITLSFRNSVAGITSSAIQRKGRITRVEGPLVQELQPGPSSAASNDAERIEVEFTPNLSQSFVPYIMEPNPADKKVYVTRRSLHKTVARSVARFTICLASLILVFTVRVVLLSFFMHGGLARKILYVAEVGRMVLILMQESSILTYSCAYKCVETWACQGVYDFGPRWNHVEQEEFHRDVVEFIGHAIHAQAVFWAVQKLWEWMGEHSTLWQRNLGDSISATFASPSADAFAESRSFRLQVLELKPLSTHWKEKYHVDFQVPGIAIAVMSTRLYATKSYRGAAIAILPLAACGYIGPAGFLTEETSMAGKVGRLISDDVKEIYKVTRYAHASLRQSVMVSGNCNCTANFDPRDDAAARKNQSNQVDGASGRGAGDLTGISYQKARILYMIERLRDHSSTSELYCASAGQAGNNTWRPRACDASSGKSVSKDEKESSRMRVGVFKDQTRTQECVRYATASGLLSVDAASVGRDACMHVAAGRNRRTFPSDHETFCASRRWPSANKHIGPPPPSHWRLDFNSVASESGVIGIGEDGWTRSRTLEWI
ncbi:hypothetical protein C8R45DRAFT_1079990 [Mycena sanguinolenta]|nr:hypothetical protein C8R45DRAFT_1079990 [Mycena sanguinolenta]